MFSSIKLRLLISFFLLLLNVDTVQAGYCYGRNAHEDEHAAWGGNGGSWGNVNSEWNGDHGWPDRNSYNHSFYHKNNYRSYSRANDYPSRSPYDQEYADENVDGAGLYINLR